MKLVLNENSCCVDVGAHMGSILNEMIGTSPLGHHFAFEPIPYLFEKLRADFSSEKVTILDCALSDQDGRDEFFLFKNEPGYSGLKQRKFGEEAAYLIEKIEVQKKSLMK
jgi:FkbM family methyltransferase